MGSKAASAARSVSPYGKLSPGPGMAAKDVVAHQLARIHNATTNIVAAQGYENLKVRDVVGHAEVSTRVFYELFRSKEDCFLQTYDLIARRATRRIVAAQTGEPNWRRRSQLIFEEFLRGLEEKPDDARLALVEAYAASEASREQAWRAERVFEGMLAESFARAPGGVAVPPMILEGIVAGIARVSRSCLVTERLADLSDASSELIEWALCYPDRAAVELTKLDRQSVWRDTTLESLPVASRNGDVELWPSSGDHALILAAVAELTAAKGYSGLTVPRIRALARISRRKFDAHFEDVEACYLTALEQRVSAAIAQAARAQTAARSWAGSVYRAIAALCEHVAADDFLVRVCLTDDFPPGPDGQRARQRLLASVVEVLSDGAPRPAQPSPAGLMATTGAVWSIFHHHVIRDRALHRQVAATLSYLALAPVVGASAAVEAIGDEQHA